MRSWNRVGPVALLAAGPFIVSGLTAGELAVGVLATIVPLALAVPVLQIGGIAGRARPGSLVDRADRRRPWLVALGALLLLSLMRFDSPVNAVRVTQLLASGALVAVLAYDVRALLLLRPGVERAGRLRPRTPDSPPIDARTVVRDFGLGDEELEELEPPAAIYRERERVVRVVRGSRPAAVRALVGWIVFDLALGLIVLLVTAAALGAEHMYAY